MFSLTQLEIVSRARQVRDLRQHQNIVGLRRQLCHAAPVVPQVDHGAVSYTHLDKTTAFDYLAQDTILCAGEAGRGQETLRALSLIHI